MAKLELKQDVKLFIDEKSICEQTVLIDTDDELENWMVISHDEEEISMSVRNWDALVKLVEIAKKDLKI